MKQWIATGAVLAAASTALLAGSDSAAGHDDERTAVLRDPSGRFVGVVTLVDRGDATIIRADLRPNPYVTPSTFHGFHVHANNDPANGSGCVADPSQPSSTWFVSADGHLAEPGQVHGHHAGDMPSPLILEDGRTKLRFTTDRIDPSDLRRRVVILHAGTDNFGNVPTGMAANQYTPNDLAATELTQRTGNAGDRVACGILRR